MAVGEWFKMSKPQRIAALVLIVLIMAVTAIKVSMTRSKPLPQEVETRAIELAKFRQEIDSAKIDTVLPTRRKKTQQKAGSSIERQMEIIPTH